MRHLSLLVAIAPAALLFSSPVSASVKYLGSHQAGVFSADYTIVTDGKIGALSADDISSFKFTLNQSGGGNYTIDSGEGGYAGFDQTNLAATASGLTFDYNGQGDNGFFTADNGPSYQFNPGYDYGYNGSQGSLTHYSGMQTIASAAPVSAAPEPGSWAMMILGGGIIGGALWRKRSGPAATVTVPSAV